MGDFQTPGRGRLLPRSLRSSALLFDLAIGAGLTVYLTAATSLSGIEFGWEFGRDLIEGVAVGLRRVWTIPALAAVMVVTAFNDLTTWPIRSAWPSCSIPLRPKTLRAGSSGLQPGSAH